MSTFKVRIGFLDPKEPIEHPHCLYLSCLSVTSCIRDVIRWIEGRRKAIPEIFGAVGYIEIDPFVPDTIDYEGQLRSAPISSTQWIKVHTNTFHWKEGHVQVGSDPNIWPIDGNEKVGWTINTEVRLFLEVNRRRHRPSLTVTKKE